MAHESARFYDMEETQDRRDLGQLLKHLAQRRSAGHLARLVGISSSYVQAIWGGRRPSLEVLEDYLRAIDVGSRILEPRAGIAALTFSVDGLDVHVVNLQPSRGARRSPSGIGASADDVPRELLDELVRVWKRTAKQRWGSAFFCDAQGAWWEVQLDQPRLYEKTDGEPRAHLRCKLIPVPLTDGQPTKTLRAQVLAEDQEPGDLLVEASDWFVLAAWAGPPTDGESAVLARRVEQLQALVRLIALRPRDVGIDSLDARSPIERRLGRPEYEERARIILQRLIDIGSPTAG